jgi:ubiquinol-cytochrome c reductase iron-sulfur subunit
MAVANPTQTVPGGVDDPSKRDFLYIATAAVGVVGAASVVWPLVDQMQPDAATIAAGAPLEVNIGAIEPGQQIVVKWRGHPIFVVNRTPESLKTLQDPQLLDRLRDPNSDVEQQPKYAENWHRSLKPEYLVLVGVCTHLGCIPKFEPDKGTVTPDWLGGYFCPCHGSKYDLSGRVYAGVPAPYNLPVPPYTFVNDKTLRIGANPEGQTFELDNVVQL